MKAMDFVTKTLVSLIRCLRVLSRMPLPLATHKRLFFLWNESKETHPERFQIRCKCNCRQALIFSEQRSGAWTFARHQPRRHVSATAALPEIRVIIGTTRPYRLPATLGERCAECSQVLVRMAAKKVESLETILSSLSGRDPFCFILVRAD